MRERGSATAIPSCNGHRKTGRASASRIPGTAIGSFGTALATYASSAPDRCCPVPGRTTARLGHRCAGCCRPTPLQHHAEIGGFGFVRDLKVLERVLHLGVMLRSAITLASIETGLLLAHANAAPAASATLAAPGSPAPHPSTRSIQFKEWHRTRSVAPCDQPEPEPRRRSPRQNPKLLLSLPGS